MASPVKSSRYVPAGGRAAFTGGSDLTGRPRDPAMAAAFFALRVVDGFENTRDHATGAFTAMLADAGFGDVRVEDRLRTAWGSLELLSARE